MITNYIYFIMKKTVLLVLVLFFFSMNTVYSQKISFKETKEVANIFSLEQTIPADNNLKYNQITPFIFPPDKFIQKDLSRVVAYVISNTDTANYDVEDYQMWEKYLCSPHPTVETFENYFYEASQEFGVPVEILKAIGQVESNWTQIGPSIDRGWGVMHLVDNDYSQTLIKASELIGLEPQILKDNARHNIRGMAALISFFAGIEKNDFRNLEDWFEVLKKITGLYSDDLAEMQVKRYYDLIKYGVSNATLWGETIQIQAKNEINILDKLNQSNKWIFPSKNRSSDYGPAISSFISSCNYSPGRFGHSIDTWVNHWVGTGTYAGAISWFHNCSANASAHFVIRTSDGQITQCVHVNDMAWHAGAIGYPNNQRSIGVEHEATAANPSQWNSYSMLNESAKMARYFCDQYSISMTRTLPGINGHNDMPGTATSCPGNLPWDTWMHFLTLTVSSPNNNATNVSVPVSFDWFSSGGSSQEYRIQVSLSNSSWTKENGFTSNTSPSSSVPVNSNTNSTSFYSWTSSSSYPPNPHTTYYWTTKVYRDGFSSYYTNVRSFTTSGAVQQPDLTIPIANTDPTIITAGSTTSLWCKVMNDGAGATVEGGRVGYYLSTNTTYESTDDFLGYNSFGILNAGSYINVDKTLTIPYSTSVGTYYILCYADYQEDIPESNESNNVGSKQIFVSGPSICTECPNYDFSINATTSWNTHPSSTVAYGCKMYRMSITEGDTYIYKTGCGDGATADFFTELYLYDGNCSEIVDGDDGCEYLRSKIEWTADYSGYVYLKVKGEIE